MFLQVLADLFGEGPRHERGTPYRSPLTGEHLAQHRAPEQDVHHEHPNFWTPIPTQRRRRVSGGHDVPKDVTRGD